MFHNFRPTFNPLGSYKKQKGSVLVLAIFIMVVMLLLGAALVRLLSSSAESIAYEVVGTRAYNAANTGLQAKLSALFPLNTTALQCDESTPVASLVDGAPPPVDTISSNYLPSLNGVPGLANCEVTRMVCSNFKQDDVTYYRLTSTGECLMDGSEVTSRTIVVEARTLE